MNRRGLMNRRGFLTGSLAALVTAAGSSAWAACPVTAANPEGPFYVPGAPFRRRLAPPDLLGRPLHLSGQVRSGDCEPLAGAVLDVWHANADGFYYGLETPRPLSPEEYLLRGRIRTDSNGRYAFDTILPGNYRMGPNWARARHIHLIVSHPPGRRLTTQLYFAGDPLNQTDPLVKSSLVIPLQEQKQGTALAGTFDIVLP